MHSDREIDELLCSQVPGSVGAGSGIEKLVKEDALISLIFK
jgi:hypothetical protein